MRIFDAEKTAALCGTYDSFRLYRDINLDTFPTPDTEIGKAILAMGEKCLQTEIPLLPLSYYRLFSETGDRITFETPYFARRGLLLGLCSAEMVERKGRFMRKLCDVLWAILEESTWVIHAHNRSFADHDANADIPDVKDEISYIDLFSAGTGGDVALVLYFLGNELEKEVPKLITQRMRYELRRRILDPYIKYNDFWWRGYKTKNVNNWCPWITSNVLLVSAVLSENTDERRYVLSEACKSLEVFADTYGEDGGCSEGPGYWDVAGASLFDCLETIYDMTDGRVSLFDNPLVRAMMDYRRKANICGDYCFNCADAHPRCGYGATVRRMGIRCDLEKLHAFGALNKNLPVPQEISRSGTALPYRGFKNYFPVPKAESEYRAETFTCLPDLQNVFFRTSEDPEKGLYLGVKGGNNAESHNHNDVGNFILYADGQPVIIDAGVGTYTKDTFSSKRYTLFAMGSEYHNLPIICGEIQHDGPEFRAASFDADEKNKCVTVDITPAYDDKKGVLKSFVRSCGIKDENSAEVSDALLLTEKGSAEFRFFTCVCPSLTGNTADLGSVVAEFCGCDSLSFEPIKLTDPHFISDWQTDTLYVIKAVCTGEKITLRSKFTKK